MECIWQDIGNNEFQCPICKTIRNNAKLVRRCRPEGEVVVLERQPAVNLPIKVEIVSQTSPISATPPAIIKQYKQRLDEEKDVIRGLCGGCEHFKNNRCEFSTCGCSENYDQRYANILNIVGANCPAKKWGQETINDELEPSFLEKAKSAASAVISHVETGLTKVSTEVQKERLAKCGPCRFRKGANCQKCGCILALKTEMSSQSCPIGEWGQETEEGRLRSG